MNPKRSLPEIIEARRISLSLFEDKDLGKTVPLDLKTAENMRLKLPTGERAQPSHSAPMIRMCTALFITALILGAGSARATPPGYETVIVDTVKTSIYVGNVTLTTTPFHAAGGRFSADYRAKVFPYFFSNEHGSLWIALSDEDLARLVRGERVNFTGRAENSDKEERRIEGFATPTDSKHGKIKVRVFVSKKIELIFNAGYRFE